MAEQYFLFTKGLMFKILAVELSASAFQNNIKNGVMKICGLNLAGRREGYALCLVQDTKICC